MKTVQREVQVAFSPRAQPWWFRVIKWSVLITAIVRYRQRRWFPSTLGGTLLLALSLHFFYRYKTQAWQRPWGGWDDVVP